jgi:hypothetical protein
MNLIFAPTKSVTQRSKTQLTPFCTQIKRFYEVEAKFGNTKLNHKFEKNKRSF